MFYTPVYVYSSVVNTGLFIGVFSHPAGVRLGSGKSVFCLKRLLKVYGSWSEARKYVVFTAEELLQLARGGGVRAVLWDDVGVWSHHCPKGFRGYLPEVRERVGRLYLTASGPSALPSWLRRELDYYVYIYRPHPFLGPTLPPGTARAYVLRGELRKYAEPEAVITFRLHFPFYREYGQMREEYVSRALKLLARSLGSCGGR